MSDRVIGEPTLPPRPVIPPLASALIACILTQQWVLTSAPSEKSCVVLIVVSLVVICCALIPRVPLPPLPAATIASAVIAGLISASAFASSCKLATNEFAKRPVSSFTFEITSDASAFGDRWRSRAQTVGDTSLPGDLWLVSSERLSLGDKVCCVGQFSAPEDDSWGRRDFAQGICGTVSVKRITSTEETEGLLGSIYALRRGVLSIIQPQKSNGRALLAGCACGYRIDLVTTGVEDVLSKSGLVHLVAVSGGHLTTVASLLNMVLEKTNLRGASRFFIVFAATALFTVFCGAPTSAVRAWVMTSAAMLGPLIGRKSHGLSAASVAGLVLCLIDPATASDMGFQLSALSVAGLYIFSPYVEYLLACLFTHKPVLSFLPRFMQFRCERIIQSLITQVATSIVAQLVTIPITVVAFGTIPVIGPLANALLGPAFSCFVSLGCIAMAFLWVPYLGGVLLQICELFATAILVVSFALSSIPGACMAVGDMALPFALGAVFLAVFLLIFWPPVSKQLIQDVCTALLAILIGFHVVVGLAAGERLVVLDVGQGDAILFQDGTHAVLVDTGPDDAIVQALARNHIDNLDAVIITHLHDDHYGGLDELVGFVQVKRVYVGQGVTEHMPDEMRDALRHLGVAEVSELAFGDKLSFGHFTLEVLSPEGPTDGLENEDSLVMLAQYSQNTSTLSALLCGDAEADVTEPLARGGQVGNIDVLKLGHHGSEASVSEEMLEHLQPEVCVASAGEGNRYGHPAPSTMEMVKRVGSYGICTMDSGDVCIKPREDGISLSCAMPYDGATKRSA